MRSEIIEEAEAHGGRITFAELQELTSVDVTLIEQSVAELVKQDGASFKLVGLGTLVTRSYVDRLVRRTVDSVLQAGSLAVGLVSTREHVPIPFLGG